METVDLGLPSGLLWAKCNVGAEKETDYGDYFMWGSTTPNTNVECSWANVPFNNSSWNFEQEYFDSVKDTVCPNGVLAPEYDACSQVMGGDWRLPTKGDFDELIEGTTHEWVENYQGSGINGSLFTSKANGNTMFIPASGCRWGTSFDCVGDFACIWSSALFADYEYGAWYLFFNSDYCSTGYHFFRYDGFCLRGVRKPSKKEKQKKADEKVKKQWKEWVEKNDGYNMHLTEHEKKVTLTAYAAGYNEALKEIMRETKKLLIKDREGQIRDFLGVQPLEKEKNSQYKEPRMYLNPVAEKFRQTLKETLNKDITNNEKDE